MLKTFQDKMKTYRNRASSAENFDRGFWHLFYVSMCYCDPLNPPVGPSNDIDTRNNMRTASLSDHPPLNLVSTNLYERVYTLNRSSRSKHDNNKKKNFG